MQGHRTSFMEVQKKIFCCTGVSSSEEKVIEQFCERFDLKYSQKYEPSSDPKKQPTLIVKKVGSEKHAQAIKRHLCCVSLKYVEDCNSEGRLLPTSEYSVQTSIYFPGASEVENELLLEFCNLFNIIRCETVENDHCMVVVSGSGSSAHNLALDKALPCVSVKYIEECLTRKEFLSVTKFSIPPPPPRPFMGLTICVTNLEPVHRKEIGEFASEIVSVSV